MKKPFSFVVLSKETLSYPQRARKQLLFKALLNQPEVKEILYVEPSSHFGSSSIRQISHSPKFFVCERGYLLKGERFSAVRFINRWMAYQVIKRHLGSGKRWHTIFYNPWDIHLANLLTKHGPVIFDWTEDWGELYNNSLLGAQQNEAIKISSAVITVSEKLFSRAESIAEVNKEILFLPNATALKVPPDTNCPNEMKQIPFPRIGYAGSLVSWINRDLILELAEARPDWHWVMVGPSDDLIAAFFNKCNNIHLLGARNYKLLQKYLSQCQVLVAPYKNGVEGDATKLYDYLTLGLPIVSTEMSTAKRLQPWVQTANDKDTWLALINDAINENNETLRKARQQLSIRHTWDVRAASLLEWLNKIDGVV